jgi:NADPH:quinone reductase-like Zn-dependent oxidoreductase
MQVIQFKQFGDPSQLELAERSCPKADGENALVRIEAASVNPSDVKNVAGRMSQTTLPRVPGRDFSGVVVDGPDDWLGQEVWGTGGDVGFTRDGTHAEYVVVPRSSLVRKPARLSHEEAGSAGVAFVTAWRGLVDYAALRKDEAVAVMGATGGVGSAVVQIAKRIGARVFAINRSRPSAGSRLACLADLLLDSGDPNLASTLRSFNDGHGADVVFNAAGGSMFEVGLGLLAHRGRQVEITSPAGRRASLDLVDFYHNESQLIGVDTLKMDLTSAARILEKLTPFFEEGSYDAPVIAKTMPLCDARQAYELVGAGERGRVVLKPSLRGLHSEATPPGD